MQVGKVMPEKRDFQMYSRRLSIFDRGKAKWKSAREKELSLYASGKGARYKVFKKRPINENIMKYYEMDVKYLPMQGSAMERKGGGK